MNLPDLAAAMRASLPTHEELERENIERIAAQRDALAAPGAFLVISLQDWLDKAVRGSGVMYVDAQAVASLPRSAWDHFENPSPEQAEQIREYLRAAQGAVAAEPAGSVMLRWDFCSSLDLKSLMAEGLSEDVTQRQHAATQVDLGDPRAFDIVFDYPRDTIEVFKRPWVRARMVDGYPLEFRVFVRDNTIQGIASYYPQRPLPESADILDAVKSVRDQTLDLVQAMLHREVYPWMLGYERAFKRGTINASIDFLIHESGRAVFLEAGPAAGFGAHPCAFLDRKIEGVALALGDGVELR